MRRLFTVLLSAVLFTAQAGCLGTVIEAPTSKGASYGGTRVHVIASPTLIKADSCKEGISETATYVPLWGLVVGILTFGILVPMNTVYTCRS